MSDEERMLDVLCCACRRPLRDGGRCVNIVPLDRLAEWEYPTWGDPAVPACDGRAVALLCDICVTTGRAVEWAVESMGAGRVAYHPVKDLFPVPPALEPPLRFVTRIKQSGVCWRR